MKSYLIGFFIGIFFFIFLFIHTSNFYKNTSSIFFVNSNYNTYLFEDGESILPTKYKYVNLEDIPEELIYMLLWSEDRDFYEHYGVNIKALFRATLINIKNRSFSQGGSTLSQQLAKTLYLTNEKTIMRKVMDMMLAFFLERSYTKDEILEAYMNSVYLGNDISGFGAASERYFKKDLNDLDYNEMSMLVGIINGPELYNPYKYPDRAKNQASILLNSIHGNELIKFDKSNIEKMVNDIQIYKLDYKEDYLDFIYQVKKEEEALNLKGGGYKIKTTFNRDLYDSFTLNASESSIVINNKTGSVESFWGGEYSIFISNKQIGSVIKPFYYALALDKGYTFDTILPDEPMDFGGWRPNNYDKNFRGEISLEDAIVKSINIPSIYLATHIEKSPTDSIEKIKNFLESDIGLKGMYPEDLTLALGTVETNPFELIKAFTIFPNYGLIPKIYTISEIYDRKGNLIYKKYPEIDKKIDEISIKTYSSMNNLLRQVIERGSAKRINIEGIDLHGKTGTPELSTWFSGYTGNKSIVVRVDGVDLLSSTSAVPVAGNIVKNFIYSGYNLKVPKYMNAYDDEQKLDFFEDPITFVSKGMDVIEYLKFSKLKYSTDDLNEKLKEANSQLEYIYPDVVNRINEWKNINLVDFMKDPYSFIQNGYNLRNYLENISITDEIKKKLLNISDEIKYLYPDQASLIIEFISEKGL
ncbi:penicillin-binding protein [Oceanotoga sp. DSM 15011]|uniref:transglycosylase domain-containing protein n=1 Tax=Oceanotoga sp. DSM 15011 TaxID=2984951 RepID=UPI0021F3F304|nr:penicillin-binding protein [Oceanotoga sp. DSM 15011]UYO99831.1 penicillin-binding protein [Oceanotoga sp. DSM 15011]